MNLQQSNYLQSRNVYRHVTNINKSHVIYQYFLHVILDYEMKFAIQQKTN